MKRIISFVLCIAVIMGMLSGIAGAADVQKLAEDLKTLGLFKGVSETDFALDRAPTRTEALVMLIRVLGKEQAALDYDGEHPFEDVPEWADKYVGYAYSEGLTNGISETRFGGEAEASAAMYITFVLRALGYSDAAGEDFTWDNPFELAKSVGLMSGEPDVDNFMREDVVLISYAALAVNMKDESKTLASKLVELGAFAQEEFDANYDTDVFGAEKPTDTDARDAKAVFDELANLIVDNKDAEEKGVAGCELVLSEDDSAWGYMYYDKNNEVITVSVYYAVETLVHGATMAFKVDEEETALVATIYESDNLETPETIGAAVVKKTEYIVYEDPEKVMDIEFETYTGAIARKEIAKGSAGVMAGACAFVLDSVLETLPDYDGTELEKLGFINYKA